jgi:hypothetical protein
MRYSLYSCSTHEAIDTLEMHVLAKAYHCAWRSAWASDPAGPHLVHALDLIIDFGRTLPAHAAPGAPAAEPKRHTVGVAAPAAQARDPGSRDSGMGGLEIAAAEFARRAHSGQVLEDGVTPYFDGHVMAVVDILVEIDASEETIVAGYLHDVPAITRVTLDQIEEAFGAHIAALVGGASGVARHTEQTSGVQQASLKLERLALESAEAQTLALAHDLANLRNPQWLRQAVRAGFLAEMAERVDRLVLADPQLQRHVRAALALWRAIPWAFEPGEPGK